MALLVCPDCKKQVSDRASTCPNCGCPIDAIKAASVDMANVALQDAKDVLDRIQDLISAFRPKRAFAASLLALLRAQEGLLTMTFGESGYANLIEPAEPLEEYVEDYIETADNQPRASMNIDRMNNVIRFLSNHVTSLKYQP